MALYRVLHDLNGRMDKDTGERPLYRAGSTVSDTQIADAGFDGGIDRLLNRPGTPQYKPGFSPALVAIPGESEVSQPETVEGTILSTLQAVAPMQPSTVNDASPKPENTPPQDAPLRNAPKAV